MTRKTVLSVVMQVVETQVGTGWQLFLTRRRQKTLWQNLPAYSTGDQLQHRRKVSNLLL